MRMIKRIINKKSAYALNNFSFYATAEISTTDYIFANAAYLEFNYTLEEGNFLGLKTVAQGIFGEVFFIPAPEKKK